MEIRLSSTTYNLTPELEKYTRNKLVGLERKVPRKYRSLAHCQVMFAQRQKNGTKFSTCSVGLTFDGMRLKSEETTQHMYAALDIAVVYVEQQLRSWVKAQRHERKAAHNWQLP